MVQKPKHVSGLIINKVVLLTVMVYKEDFLDSYYIPIPIPVLYPIIFYFKELFYL